MSEELEDMTPNQRRALSKGLAALETMADLWAAEIQLSDMAARIASVADADERAKHIAAMIEQGFIEGAYRHYLDHKDACQRMEQAARQSAGATPINDDLKATSGPLLELDVLLAKFHDAVWEAAQPAGEFPATAYDEAGSAECKAIQQHVRAMLAGESNACPHGVDDGACKQCYVDETLASDDAIKDSGSKISQPTESKRVELTPTDIRAIANSYDLDNAPQIVEFSRALLARAQVKEK